MTDKPRIFLSHSSEDKELAEELAKQIRDFLGFSQREVFVSSEPEGIDAGADWFQKVSNALESSEAIVVLVTPESMKSNWVWFEIGHFWNKNRDAIIPVHIPSANIPHPLNTRQSKSLADEREIKVIFNVLKELFGVGDYTKINTSSLIALTSGKSPSTSQDVIKAKLLDYLKNDYNKIGDAVIYRDLEEKLKLPSGSAKQHIKNVIDGNYEVEEESENLIRLQNPTTDFGYSSW